MRQRHDSSHAATTGHAGAEPGRRWPGKVSLTQRMASSGGGLAPPTAPPPAPSTPVQRAQVEHDLAASLGFLGGPAASIDASLAATSPAAPVQRAADGHTGLDDAQVAAHAAAGVRGAGQPLPHLDTIQRAFGPAHDLSGVRAHVGGGAAEASAAIGAHAYATGNDVAFAGAPDLFLAAHEAAHVVQQRQGVHLKGAVGQAGDSYEQHADTVAAAVVRGESAAALLGEAGPGGAASPLQRKETEKEHPPVGPTRRTLAKEAEEEKPPVGPTRRKPIEETEKEHPPVGPTRRKPIEETEKEHPPVGPTRRTPAKEAEKEHPPVGPTRRTPAKEAEEEKPPVAPTRRTLAKEAEEEKPPVAPTRRTLAKEPEEEKPPVAPTRRRTPTEDTAKKSPPAPVRRKYGGRFEASCDDAPKIEPGGAATKVVLTSTNEVRFAFDFDKPPDHEQITCNSKEEVLSGSEASCKLSTGAWSGDQVVWTAEFKRPVKTRLSFRVLDHGRMVNKASYDLDVGMDRTRLASGAEGHMETRKNDKMRVIESELAAWRNETSLAFINAKTRVNEIIEKDTKKGQAIDSAALSILSTVLGGAIGAVAGPAVKGLLIKDAASSSGIKDAASSGLGAKVLEELASDIPKALVGGSVSAGFSFAAPEQAAGLSKNELAEFLKYDNEILALKRALIMRLQSGNVVTNEARYLLLEDPIGVLNEYVAAAKIPLARRSEESIERELWTEWLQSIGAHATTNGLYSQALESPILGVNYERIMARLDELNVAYAHPDSKEIKCFQEVCYASDDVERDRAAASIEEESMRNKNLAAQEAKDHKQRTKDFSREFIQPNE